MFQGGSFSGNTYTSNEPNLLKKTGHLGMWQAIRQFLQTFFGDGSGFENTCWDGSEM